jgi:hypothetical protein
MIGVTIFALAIFALRASAQEHATEPAQTSDAMHTLTDVHEPPAEGDRPVVPTDAAAWAGATLIIIIAMFLMAAVIGPMVRMEIPVESHDDHGHGHDDHGHGHDDHGSSHGH